MIKRKIKTPIDMVKGVVHTTNGSGEIEIIKYTKQMEVLVRFLNTNSECLVTAGNIRSGRIKDKMSKTVLGVGFFGIGPHKAKVSGT